MKKTPDGSVKFGQRLSRNTRLDQKSVPIAVDSEPRVHIPTANLPLLLHKEYPPVQQDIVRTRPRNEE